MSTGGLNHRDVSPCILTIKTIKKTNRETYDHLCKAYGSGAMSKQNAYRVFKVFQEEGRTDYRGQRGQHESPRGSPKQRTEVSIAKIRELIKEDARMTFEALAYESGIGIATVKKIVKQDLGLTKKCARWVPRLLTGKAYL